MTSRRVIVSFPLGIQTPLSGCQPSVPRQIPQATQAYCRGVPFRATLPTMPILENPRQEKFCQLRATGMTLEQAYAEAGYKADAKNAERMTKNDGVKARILELQAETVERFEVTVETIARQLDEDRDFAYACKQPGAAATATIAKAKLFGLMVDRNTINVTHNYSMMTIEELKFELAALNAEARSLKPGVN